MKSTVIIAMTSALAALPGMQALAATPQAAVLGGYAAAAKAADHGFAGFSVARGQQLFTARQSGGKPETPSCTTCHTSDPRQVGRTRAGKDIAPMAASAKPDRYADPEETEKWFGRNCRSVMGRACTPQEKGDFITFMMSQ